MDAQGRLTIAEWLRNKFGLKGEIELAVVGKANHMEIRIEEEFSKTRGGRIRSRRKTWTQLQQAGNLAGGRR